jgi:hypothetical protein
MTSKKVSLGCHCLLLKVGIVMTSKDLRISVWRSMMQLLMSYEKQTPVEPGPNVDGDEVLEGRVYDFHELECIERSLVPLGFDSEVLVIGEDMDGGSWDVKAFMSLNGIIST